LGGFYLLSGVYHWPELTGAIPTAHHSC